MRVLRGMVAVLVATWGLTVALSAYADPVSEDTAMTLVNNWLNAGKVTGYTAKSVQAVTAEDGAILHYVVKCNPKGFVIVASDTRMEPIIAFSQADNARSDNPLFSVARRDTSVRHQLLETADALRSTSVTKKLAQLDAPVPVDTTTEDNLITQLDAVEQEAASKWSSILTVQSGARKSSGSTDPLASIRATRDTVAYDAPQSFDAGAPVQGFAPAGLTVWADPIISTSWDQNKQFGSFGSNLYNLMTPSNRLAGCGPVALAQVMRYHNWPRVELGATSGVAVVQLANGSYVTNLLYPLIATYTNVGTLRSMTNMSLEYKNDVSASITWTNVSSLMTDIGVAAGATYYTNQTGTTLQNLHIAMTNVFKYPRAVYGSTNSNMSPILNRNILGGKPVVMAFYNDAAPAAGHIAVVDGLAISAQSTAFHHINLGWGEVGENTAWYNLPTVIAYNTIQGYIHNIMTNGEELVVGRILDSTSAPVSNVTITIGSLSTTSDVNGAYGLEVASGSTNTVTISKIGYVTQTYVVTNGTTTGNTSGNTYNGITLARSPAMSFTAQTYGSNIVLTWSSPTNSFYPADIRILATTNSAGAEEGYSTYWTNGTRSTQWFTNWVAYKPVTTNIANASYPTNRIFGGDGDATTSITLSNMPLSITYYFKMWTSNSTGLVQIENGTSSAYVMPDANKEILYFQETNATGRAYFMMPKAGIQTNAVGAVYQWKYKGFCSDSNMSLYTLAGSADFNSNGTPDIVWQRKTSSIDQNENYMLWLMKADGTLQTTNSMQVPANISSQWPVMCVKDMNTDSHPDVVIGSISDGRMAIFNMTNGVYSSTTPSITNTTPLSLQFKALGSL